MNKNLIIILLFLGIIAIAYIWHDQGNDYKEQIKQIERERDSLKADKTLLVFKNDSLSKLEPEIRWRYKQTEQDLKDKQDETDEIPGIVATYTNNKLDSILSNYRFKQRAKNRDSINP